VAVEVVFETHSLTEDNENEVATGWLPGRLSAEGRLLAAELGERRRDDGIAVVFTSDLARAVETAEIAFAGGGIPVRTDARLRECDYGDWNGMPVRKLQAERSKRIREPFPAGESYLDVVVRTREFLAELVRSWDGKRVLVISHSANRWALDHLLGGAALEDLVDSPFGWREGWTYRVPEHCS
jgi:broad specificity phosphatase PhoE